MQLENFQVAIMEWFPVLSSDIQFQALIPNPNGYFVGAGVFTANYDDIVWQRHAMTVKKYHQFVALARFQCTNYE